MTLKILILEDDKNRIVTFRSKLSRHDLVFVEEAADAIDKMQNDSFDVIFLDHDLGGRIYVDPGEQNTGSEVVRWMAAYGDSSILNQPYVIVHSMNHHAANSMVSKLEEAQFGFVYRIPFIKLVSSYLDDPSFLA